MQLSVTPDQPVPSATASASPSGQPSPVPTELRTAESTAAPPLSTILPAELPDDAKSGTVETVYGDAQLGAGGPRRRRPAGHRGPRPWLRADGWLSTRTAPTSNSGCPGIWSSADLLGPWRQQRLPDASDTGALRGLLRTGDAHVQLLELDGTYWLSAWLPSGAQTWRADGSGGWVQLDTDGLPFPDREAFTWERAVQPPVASGTTTILPIIYSTSDIPDLLGIPSAFENGRSPGADRRRGHVPGLGRLG